MAETMTTKADEFATVIGADAQFKGELSFQGGVRIDGRFEGTIHTNGKVFVSKTGQLKAEVQANALALEGRLEGNVTAEDRVELRATGQLVGDLRAAKLLVVEGATLAGRCDVGSEALKGRGAAPKAAQPEMRPVGAGQAQR